MSCAAWSAESKGSVVSSWLVKPSKPGRLFLPSQSHSGTTPHALPPSRPWRCSKGLVDIVAMFLKSEVVASLLRTKDCALTKAGSGRGCGVYARRGDELYIVRVFDIGLTACY